MRKYLFILLAVSILSCRRENNKDVIAGKKIKISYNIYKINSLKDNDFISIDNIKYVHKSKIDNSKPNIFLPSKENILLTVEGKELKEKGNIINISSALIRHLRKTNSYQFKKPNKNVLLGKLVFKRKDDKEISIKVSKNYPISIKVVK